MSCRYCKPRAQVYWSERYGGSWVSAVDHGGWVDEKFWNTWQQAMDNANYMAALVRSGHL